MNTWKDVKTTGLGGRFQLVITKLTPGGRSVDVTTVRRAETQLSSYSSSDPFGDSTAVFQFPSITPFDDLDAADLGQWLGHYSNVDLYWVPAVSAALPGYSGEPLVINALTNQPDVITPTSLRNFSGVRTGDNRIKVWEGFLASIGFNSDTGSAQLEIECQGALFQLDRYLQKPFYPPQPWPLELLIADTFDRRRKPNLRTQPLVTTFPAGWKNVVPAYTGNAVYIPVAKPGSKWTGYSSRQTGGWDHALTGFVQDQLTVMLTDKRSGVAEGNQWTVQHLRQGSASPLGRQPVLEIRDRFRAPDFAMWVGTPGLDIGGLQADSTQSENVVYGEGTDIDGTVWRNAVISNDGSRTDYLPLAASRQVYPPLNNPAFVRGGFVSEAYALADGTPVLTPTGWRAIESLQPGETVADPDGGTARVLGTFPQGEKQLYEVRLSDGTTIEATEDHLWRYELWLSRDRRKQHVGTTAELSARLESKYNVHLPELGRVDLGDGQVLAIDPYRLGLLLGDGGLSGRTGLRITTCDPEIADEFVTTHIVGPDYYIREPRLFGQIERLGLHGKRSHEKWVPREFLWASYRDRLALLQGLMDTDGTIDTHARAGFCSTSEQLARDVEFLVRSLGGRCGVQESDQNVRPVPFPQGHTSIGRPIWRVTNIRFADQSVVPFRLARKVSRMRTKRRVNGYCVESITPSRRALATCIAVDSPSQCYVTTGFTITHNTKFGTGLSQVQGVSAAEQQLARDQQPGWSGSIIIRTDPSLILPKWLIRAGMTILLRGFAGTGESGMPFHISAVSVSPMDGSVNLTVDTRYRDLLTVEEALERTRDPLTPVKMLQVNRTSVLIDDIQAPWDYSAGSGYIPKASIDFHRWKPAAEAYPYVDWREKHPPLHYPSWYVKVNAGAPTRAGRWSGPVPILTSEKDTIIRTEFALCDLYGRPLKVPFHVSLYYVNVTVAAMPRDGLGPSPYINGAFESLNPATGQAWPAGSFLAPDQSMIIGWGNRSAGVFNRAGFWPSRETDGASPSGLFVDDASWSYDNTNNPNYNRLAKPGQRQTASAITIYAMFYCEYTSSVYIQGRLFRQNPGVS